MAGATVAIGLVLTPSSALAADCGSPAKQAVYQTVTTPAVPAVEIDVLVIDSEAVPAVKEVSHIERRLVTPEVPAIPGTPEVPAVYEDVKIIDVAAQPEIPGTPAIPAVTHTEVVVDEEAYDEIVVDKEAYTEVIPGFWYNWAYNKDTQPFDGPPAFPTDPRGTWVGPHTDGGPAYVGDDEGSYQTGNPGKPNWFHRGPERSIDHPAETHVVHHDAVTHEETVIDVPEVPAVPGTPAVEEVSHIEHRLVTPAIPAVPEVPAVPAVYEDVKVVDVEAVPAKEEVSHLETIELTPGSPATSKDVLVSKAVAAGEPCPPASPAPAMLPHTGSELVAGGITGALLLAGGVLLTVAARRRTQQD